ncbi:hypothetical protein B0A55_11787 [Friedmanniomyces simplex]|uniref:WSC domain-containing protein n=1 Tax=Friedmanniomyces simplex TaxID=329884 RepID=A0A4U0WFM4_9PEZI|nr:hypothetical protein B0A55_11787 [Friedmanniomyces simplex]
MGYRAGHVIPHLATVLAVLSAHVSAASGRDNLNATAAAYGNSTLNGIYLASTSATILTDSTIITSGGLGSYILNGLGSSATSSTGPSTSTDSATGTPTTATRTESSSSTDVVLINTPYKRKHKFNKYKIRKQQPHHVFLHGYLRNCCGPSIVSGASTYYANRVYISIETAYAYNKCGPVGGNHTGTLLTLESSGVYSVCNGFNSYTDCATQFNFGDLNKPVPPQAYSCMQACRYLDNPLGSLGVFTGGDYVNGMYYSNACGPIINSLYAPMLAVRPQVRTLDPAWATCSFDLLGLYDPPKQLTPQTTVNGPSMPTVPATPAPTKARTAPKMESSTERTTPSTSVDASPSPAPYTPPAATDNDGYGTAGNGGSSSNGYTAPTPSNEHPSSTSGSPEDGSSAGSPSANTPIGTTVASEPQATSQNPGGIIASVLKSSNDPAQPTATGSNAAGSNGESPHAGGGDPATSENVGGNIVSALATGNADPPFATTSVHAPSSENDPSTETVVFRANCQQLTTSSDPAQKGVVVVGGNRLSVGGPAAIVHGAAVSLGPAGIVADGSLIALAQPAASAAAQVAVVTIGGQTLTALPQPGSGTTSDLVLAGSTVSVGGPAATISGAIVSAGASGLVVGSQTVPLSHVPGATGGSQVIVTLGAAATIFGTVLSAASAGLVVGSSTLVYTQLSTPTADASDPEAVVTLDGQAITAYAASMGGVVIDGTTLQSGAQVTIDGTLVSQGSAGLVIGGSKTVPLSIPATLTQSGAVVTLGSQTLSAIETSGGSVVLDGQTLLPGSEVTISGVVVSDASIGVVIGGTTLVTAIGEPNGASSIGGTTLSVGGRDTTVNGIEVSAAPSGLVVAGAETVALTTRSVTAPASESSTGSPVQAATASDPGSS